MSRRWSSADLASVLSRLPEAASGAETDRSVVSNTGAIKPPKFRNQTVFYDGRRYSSKLEARYAQELDLSWIAGQILWYTTQVPFLLEAGVRYVADFLIVGLEAPHVTLVDATGIMTQTKRNKLRAVHARYGIVCLIYRRDGSLTPYHDVLAYRRKPK